MVAVTSAGDAMDYIHMWPERVRKGGGREAVTDADVHGDPARLNSSGSLFLSGC